MGSLISHLTNTKQKELLEELNYLNMEEIHSFCKKHSIPYKITIETSKGEIKITKDTDRKGIVVERIRHYLKTGSILPSTCFKKNIVRLEGVPDTVKKTDRLYYGHYEKKNISMLSLLGELTNGDFKDGAIARILIREFWSKGKAPTYVEFAKAWQKAKDEHTQPNPEWAFLADRTAGKAGTNWKEKRMKKAKNIMKLLENI